MNSGIETAKARQQAPRNPGRLWFGILGAPVVWFAYLSLAWAFVEFGCRIGFNDNRIANMPALDFLVVAATVIALVVSVAAGLAALAEWRQVQADDSEAARGSSQWQVRWFMSALGVLLSVLFTVVIILTFVPVFFLNTCGGTIG